MPPEIRRIIAVEAHRRRSGHCPVRLYSLGTGETFEINPTADGFVDMTSGVSASRRKAASCSPANEARSTCI